MRRIWIGAALVCWALPRTAGAAQEVWTSAQIEAAAERIVEGEVTSLETRWDEGDEAGIETVAWVAVERTLLGEPTDSAQVVLAGGRIGDCATWVSDEPVLVVDGSYRLTLVRDDRGRLRVLGGEAGAEPLGPLPIYDLTGSDWSHHAHPVEEDFRINVGTFDDGMVSDEQLEDAFEVALDIWNVEGGAGVYVPYGGTTSNSQYGWDNDVNLTMFSSFTWGSTLALATWNTSGGGRLSDCDIKFYGANGYGALNWSFDPDDGAPAGQYDWVQVAEHEMGHCLGLSHSNHSTAVMYGSSSTGGGWERRHLHSDDKAGLQAIYGLAQVDIAVATHWFEVATDNDDGDEAVDPGEVHELHVVLRNDGNALAADVTGTLLVDGIDIAGGGHTAVIGDLPPGENSGTAEDHLVFALSIGPGCDGEGSATMHVEVEDLAGTVWTSDSWSRDYQCGGSSGDDDDGDDDADDDSESDDDDDDGGRRRGGGDGCECRSAPAGAGHLVFPLGLVAAGLLAIRRSLARGTWIRSQGGHRRRYRANAQR